MSYGAGPSPLEYDYSAPQRASVIVLVVCGCISLAAILGLFVFMMFKTRKYRRTHVLAYIVCLLLANTMQSWGTILSLKWVVLGKILDGLHCYSQGGIKQGGNIAAAWFSFIISAHLFNLMFLRRETPRAVAWAAIAFGWSSVFLIVFIGPVAIQTEARGHYFGISGLWCWITPAYRTEQLCLEDLFQFVSVVFSFVLHVLTWSIRFDESWRLSLGRDFTDSAMLEVVRHMVWFPVAFAVTIIPVAIVRAPGLWGEMNAVPLWLQALAGAIFDLSGLINVILFLGVRRLFPAPEDTPEFEVDRSVAEKNNGASKEEIVKNFGVTPFLLSKPAKQDVEAQPEPRV
ncbi:hypothetical protein HMN09_00958100 [Mycena chlorophos]|uniref:Glucose receptor Git3 N-terminal domain-containing protein n=1 Tax=Mycena chlorophos TaxID=658473 RepID=A0A8H6W3U8_MYCCL|nr:hypothetical protein HMN09_00958100 [Mycena chlorophos]